MSDSQKYAEEKRVLLAFKKLMPDFPKGKIVKSESPDFILKTSPKRAIGIELVQLIVNEEAEDLFEKLIKLLQKKEEKLQLYQKKRLNNYWLIVYINSLEERSLHNLIKRFSERPFSTSFDSLFLFDEKKDWYMYYNPKII
ncbi:hypothetical protein ACFLRI_04790 [Bacteroidota bacterium]